MNTAPVDLFDKKRARNASARAHLTIHTIDHFAEKKTVYDFAHLNTL